MTCENHVRVLLDSVSFSRIRPPFIAAVVIVYLDFPRLSTPFYTVFHRFCALFRQKHEHFIAILASFFDIIRHSSAAFVHDSSTIPHQTRTIDLRKKFFEFLTFLCLLFFFHFRTLYCKNTFWQADGPSLRGQYFF